MKRRLRSIIAPSIFLAITVYFVMNALHGSRGLDAQASERAELATAQQAQAQAEAARDEWETKVAALKDSAIEPDMLNLQARKVLNLADPTDLEVPLKGPAPRN
jgi:cell division protein FtsB